MKLRIGPDRGLKTKDPVIFATDPTEEEKSRLENEEG